MVEHILGNVERIAKIDTPDSETCIITLDRPVNFFEYYLSFPILPSMYYQNEDFGTTTKIPIGTGMYKIASIDNDNIFLIKNDRWRNAKDNSPMTQNITIHKYNAIGETFNSFKLGNVDLVHTSMENYTDYVGTLGYNKRDIKERDYDFLALNCNDRILSDANVRKAISYAINKSDIVSSVYGSARVVSESPLDYGSYLHDENTKDSFNQDEAKRKLQDGGWQYKSGSWTKYINGRQERLSINLSVNEDEGRKKVANIIKEQLGNIGIGVNVIQISNARYSEILSNKGYQMIISGITNSIDPDLSYFYGSGNLANYENSDIQSKLSDLNNYKDIEKQALEDSPYIGLYRNKSELILNANMGGNFAPTFFNIYNNFEQWYRQQ